jgi:hypothetical protein
MHFRFTGDKIILTASGEVHNPSFRLILATFREPHPQPSALHNCPYFAALANGFLDCLFPNEGFDPFLQRGGKTLVPAILPESLEKWR